MSASLEIGAVILAAGRSSRLGRPKQLLILDGETLVHRIARQAVEAGCGPVLVVLGAVADSCREQLMDLPVQTLLNPDWEKGMGTSVARGVAALADTDAAGALLLACDQPQVSVAHLRRMLASHNGCRIVSSHYAGTLGIPALFPRSYFSTLQSLDGERGARGLLRQFFHQVVSVELADGALDIDAPLDWENYCASSR